VPAVSTVGVLHQTNSYFKCTQSSSKKGREGTWWIQLELGELLTELFLADESKAECN
jgi:hypothetical protein